MAWIRKRRPAPGTIFGVAALVIALGGAAFAAIPDSGGTIHGCYQKNTGNLRVVDSASQCKASENPLSWTSGAAPLRTFGQTRVSVGNRDVLFTEGPFTFTGRCRSTGSVNVAEILVSTSEDHASVFGTQDGGINDLHPGEEAAFLTVGASIPRDPFISDQVGAVAPGGTSITGVLYAGVDIQALPDQCVFGGHIAASS